MISCVLNSTYAETYFILPVNYRYLSYNSFTTTCKLQVCILKLIIYYLSITGMYPETYLLLRVNDKYLC